MTAILLDGLALAARIEGSLRSEVDTFTTMFRRPPRLVVVLAGDLAQPRAHVQAAHGARAGGRARFPSGADGYGIAAELLLLPSCPARR